MTDTSLPREQALALLQRLANDDAFRTSYETSPAAALKAAGISAEIIAALAPTSLAPTRLRSREAFQKAYEQVREKEAEVCLCHRPPEISLRSGSRTRDGDGGATTSFSEP